MDTIKHETPEGGLVNHTQDSVANGDSALAQASPSALVTEAIEANKATDSGSTTNTKPSRVVMNPTPLYPPSPLMTLWVDAAVLGNGTAHAEGYIAVIGDNGVLIDEPVGRVTNNEGELLAVQRALLVAGDDPALIYSDSLLAVNMITRKWRGRAPNLRALVKDIRLPKHIQLVWTPREENRAGHYLETAYGA